MHVKISKYRRFIQAFFFILFLSLLTLAAKRIVLPFPAQIFLAADPLVALVAIFSGLTVISGIVYAIFTAIITVFFGRIFCGYACPMGTFLDIFAPLSKLLKLDQKVFRKLKPLSILVLAFIIIMSFFRVNIFMIFDPIVLFTRTTAVTVFPAIDYVLSSITESFMRSPNLGTFADAVATKLDGILIFTHSRSFVGADWIIVLFLSILSLNLLGKRFWCRYLCPLGGLLGLIGRVPLIRRKVDITACRNCLSCTKVCDMDAIMEDGTKTDTSACLLCLKCREKCPTNAISWGLKPDIATEIPSRRTAIGTLCGTVAAAYLIPFKSKPSEKAVMATLIRPPSVENEDDFINKCIRCGECLKACPTNGLQPAQFQYGIASLWTPHFDFSKGFCDFSCNACGRVCPTGAIKELKLKKKQEFVLGKAEINRNRCIPWIAGHGCMVCYEVCPTPKKAIYLEDFYAGDLPVRRPHVDRGKCIGCGICENACPVKVEKAIKVFKT